MCKLTYSVDWYKWWNTKATKQHMRDYQWMSFMMLRDCQHSVACYTNIEISSRLCMDDGWIFSNSLTRMHTLINRYKTVQCNTTSQPLENYKYKTLISRFMETTWGPSGADRTQVDPMLAPWTLLSGEVCVPLRGQYWASTVSIWGKWYHDFTISASKIPDSKSDIASIRLMSHVSPKSGIASIRLMSLPSPKSGIASIRPMSLLSPNQV